MKRKGLVGSIHIYKETFSKWEKYSNIMNFEKRNIKILGRHPYQHRGRIENNCMTRIIKATCVTMKLDEDHIISICDHS